MLVRLFLLFTLIPLVELALLFWIAQHTGWLFTLSLVIVTGVVGAWLARQEGLRCWLEVQRQLAEGKLPAEPLLDGLMILVAGALLITPGVLTDLVGFALLVPPIRRLVRRHLSARFQAHLVVHPMQGFAAPPAEDDDVIDVEYRKTDET
ncbi:MAG TPA: FxsA family protein [Thermoguttaceae bacterium]|nr:FxsA family protein [Thermoguttaceae bacterium]